MSGSSDNVVIGAAASTENVVMHEEPANAGKGGFTA